MPDAVATPKRKTHKETLLRLAAEFKAAKTEARRNEIRQEIKREEAILKSRQAKLGGKRIPQTVTPRSKRIPSSAKRKQPVRVLVPGGTRRLPTAPVGLAGSELAGPPGALTSPGPVAVDRILSGRELAPNDFTGFPREALLGPTGSSADLSFSTASAAPAEQRTGGAASQPLGSGTPGSAGAVGDQPLSSGLTAEFQKFLRSETKGPKTLLMRVAATQGGRLTLAQLRVLGPLHVQERGQRFGSFDRMVDLFKIQQTAERNARQDEIAAVSHASSEAQRAQGLVKGELSIAESQRTASEQADLNLIKQSGVTAPELFSFSLMSPQEQEGELSQMSPDRAATMRKIKATFGSILTNFDAVSQKFGQAFGTTGSIGRARAISDVRGLEEMITRLETIGTPSALRRAKRIDTTLQRLLKNVVEKSPDLLQQLTELEEARKKGLLSGRSPPSPQSVLDPVLDR